MRNLISQLIALGPELVGFILTAPLLASDGAVAIPQTLAPTPNLDLSNLGRVAVAGDFDSVSLYTYEGQQESIHSSNGSQSLLTQYPDGAFQNLGTSDGSIQTMCPFVSQGKLAGVVLGGNFSGIAGVEAQSAALWNVNTGDFTALDGLNGVVYSVYCDADTSTVFFGGSFAAPDSMNAMSWVTNWTNLPFSGFNGPVYSITKNSKGNIVFGGQFDGFENMTTSTQPGNAQVVPVSSGNITATGSTSTAGFSDPSNIVCQTGQDGPGTTWLLADGTSGWWQGVYSFGFNPTKLRLYNTNYQGRGTKLFHFETLNSGGVPNLVYTDSDGKNQSCSTRCPLPQGNGSTSYQDFYFSPSIGMSEFRVWIDEWYGDGGGLAGIELFQDDMYSFAINEFNEPKCDDVSTGSTSSASPASLWQRVANNGTSSSDWLAAYLTNASQVGPTTNVVFDPNIQQSGNYSILMYTPGCASDDSCGHRGVVNVTGSMTSNGPPIGTTVTQTNDYDKFDQIYYGSVDVSSSSFKPQVTLSPLPGQSVPLTIVAQRVRFDIVGTTGGLNGLYEYNPKEANVSSNFADSNINTAGASLTTGATINSVIAYNDDVIVGGIFNKTGISNIMTISPNATSLANGGLNAAVTDMYLNGSTLYVAGNFSNTADKSVTGLANVASYDLDGNKWVALGAGVNGPVTTLVSLDVNITDSDTESCVTVTGTFTSVNGFGSNKAFSTSGFAVWVPSRNNWLNNIPGVDISLEGDLVTMTAVPNSQALYAGQISSQSLDLSDAVELVGSGEPSLLSLGVQLLPNNASASASKHKRAIDTNHSSSGVYTGLFYNENSLNLTVLGGQFATIATDGSMVHNLLMIDDTHAQKIYGAKGLDVNSIVAAMDTHDTTLYAGGDLNGTINGNNVQGVVAYDLTTGNPVSPQPPSLNGNGGIVNTIATQPDSDDVYFGGSFAQAGSLPCATLCYYDTSAQQWNTPASGLSGTISTMFWSSKTSLIVAGDLNISGNRTTIATFDSKKQTFTDFTGASHLPGPVTSLSVVDSSYNEFWAAGTATNNGSAFLSHYSNNAWTAVSGLGVGTFIRGVQILGVTSSHRSSPIVSSDETLLLVGNINIPNYGNASAALFDGTNFTPFVLTSKNDGSQGSLAALFVSNPNALMGPNGHHLALGLVVLIGLAIALALVALIMAAGILIERQRRRREGYVPMTMDKTGNLTRIPPETLLSHLQEKNMPPQV